MVYPDPDKRSPGDPLFSEDRIAVIEAENALDGYAGYEPIPQEPEEQNPIPTEDPINPAGVGYCPLRNEDHKLEPCPENPDTIKNYTPESNSLKRKQFPQPVISDIPELGDESQVGPSGSGINMDKEKVEEVKKIMGKIELPSSSFPSWANDVPEEEWKDFVLKKLGMQQRQTFST